MVKRKNLVDFLGINKAHNDEDYSAFKMLSIGLLRNC